MNPFRESASDATEVECTKIREAEATKRTRIEEAESTRRKRAEVRGDGWVVPWLVAGVSAVAICITVGTGYSARLDAEHPGSGCQESVEVISSSDSQRICTRGGWYEAKPVPDKPGQVLAHCHCGPKPAGSVVDH